MNLLATWLIRAAARHPEAVALIAADRTYTCRSLIDRTAALAGRLRSRGVQPGAVLAVQLASAEAAALGAHAASWLGCPLLPLNPAMPPERHDALFQAAGVQRDATGVVLDAIADTAECGRPEPTPWAESGIELLIATSGTQGEPKAVMLSGANLQAGTLASRRCLPLEAGDAWLVCLPLHHIGGMAILYRCAEAGVTAVLHDRFDPQRVWNDLEKYRITHVSLVPAMLAKLLDAGRDLPPPPSLKFALVGGGPLSVALAARARAVGWPLCATYGMSETGSQLATLCPLPEGWQPGQVGVPLPGFEAEIVGEDGRPTSGSGRIRIRGGAVMAGYANPQRQTGLGLDQGWFTSGDLGCIDAQGKLTVLGRHDDMLVSGGVNIHPQAVEEVLKRCPGVADAAVTAVVDDIWGDLLVALVVGGVSDEVLEQWCRAELPCAMRPRRFIRVSGLPRNALGKLERQVLRSLARQNLK